MSIKVLGGSSGGGSVSVNTPDRFGYLGWTSDPTVAAGTFTPVTGRVYLTRFTAVLSGSAAHVAFNVTNAGATLTAGQNFVGIYDTGQALAGAGVTLLGVSADQTTNWAAAGYCGAADAPIALTSPPALVAGQDYFFSLLCVGTTPAKFTDSQGPSYEFANAGLTTPGLGLRIARSSDPGLTSLPSSIVTSKVISANDVHQITATILAT